MTDSNISQSWELIPYDFKPIPDPLQVYFLYGNGRQALVRLRALPSARRLKCPCQTCDSYDAPQL